MPPTEVAVYVPLDTLAIAARYTRLRLRLVLQSGWLWLLLCPLSFGSDSERIFALSATKTSFKPSYCTSVPRRSLSLRLLGPFGAS